MLVLWFALFAPVLARTPPTEVVDLMLGTSVQGRPITAVRIGSGPRKLVLVGATHGFPERNTFELANQLIQHFRANPAAVPPEFRLYIIPLLNPDGLALGRRQNANGVDLNRNMDTRADSCPENDWSQRISGAYGIISDTGGPYSESEVESRLIRDFLLDADGVVFFHSNAGVVFPACEHEPSIAMARVFAEGAGYTFIPKWDRYPITGGMHDWAGGLGIAAITPELVTGDQPELAQNLAGVDAVLRVANDLLPQPQPQAVGGFAVQPIIWRAWRAWGGEQIFGLPIAPPRQTHDGWSQLFERAVLEYKPSQTDTTAVVQIDVLGRHLLHPGETVAEAQQPDARFFPETQQNVRGIFADFWQINGGLPIFGLPLRAAEQTTDDSGMTVVQQLFERALFQRPLDATGVLDVRLAPLGRMLWAHQDARSPESRIWLR